MHLQLTTHNLEISFNCDSEDHYDHGKLLRMLAELTDELENHTGVDLLITSTHRDDSDSDTDTDDEWTD